MSLQERTLVVKNFDSEKTTEKLLKELCQQGGPVRRVILRTDHAFVEYDDVESVGYSKALLDGIELFGQKLSMEPKIMRENYYKHTRVLRDYINHDKNMRAIQEQIRTQQQQSMISPFVQQNPFYNPFLVGNPNTPNTNQSQPPYVAPPSLATNNLAQMPLNPSFDGRFPRPYSNNMTRPHGFNSRNRQYGQHGQHNRHRPDRAQNYRRQ